MPPLKLSTRVDEIIELQKTDPQAAFIQKMALYLTLLRHYVPNSIKEQIDRLEVYKESES